MIKAAEKSRGVYNEYLKEEKEKEKKAHEEKKQKLEGMKTEENRLYTKLQEYKERERAAQEK